MKKPHPLLLIALCALGLNFFLPLQGQSSAPSLEVQKLITSLQQQNTAMLASQDLLEKKLATLEEEIRQARIFATRGGRGGTAQ